MTLRWLALAPILLSGTASAQSGSAGDAIVRDFAKCRSISQAEARLACFDTTAGQIETAIQSKTLTVVDRGDIRKARRSLFGFNLPRIGLFSSDDGGQTKDAEFVEINSTVASASAAPNGRAIIRLADDSAAVWQTTDPVNFLPKVGAPIRIRKGSMGTYFLAVDHGSYRGLRVR